MKLEDLMSSFKFEAPPVIQTREDLQRAFKAHLTRGEGEALVAPLAHLNRMYLHSLKRLGVSSKEVANELMQNKQAVLFERTRTGAFYLIAWERAEEILELLRAEGHMDMDLGEALKRRLNMIADNYEKVRAGIET